jgi:hypothetical protein
MKTANAELEQPKKVWFSVSDPEVISAPEGGNFLDSEAFEDLWFTANEIEEMRRRCRSQAVSGGADSSAADEEEGTSRGLEFYLTNNNTALVQDEFCSSAASRGSIRQFLALQERQKLFGRSDSFDEDSMANVLRRTSVHRQRIAHLRASQNAQAMMGDEGCAAPVASKRSSTQEIRQKHRRLRGERRTHAARSA